MARTTSHHWSFTIAHKLLGTVPTIVTSAIHHTKRFFAIRKEKAAKDRYFAELAEQMEIEDRSRYCKPVPPVCVVEVEIAGEFRNISPEPLRFVRKGTKYVTDAMGSLVAVAKGKQFRYVALAA